MNGEPNVIDLNWRATPLDVLNAWPAERALFMLHSGRVHARWARWSILATPVVRYQFHDGSRWTGTPPPALQDVQFSDDPLGDLQAILRATAVENGPRVPFAGGWIGGFSYDLGRSIEPHAQHAGGAIDDRQWPLIELGWCPQALLYDHMHRRWHLVTRSADCGGDFIDAIATNLAHQKTCAEDYAIGAPRSHNTRQKYEAAVNRAMDYIAAGDIFQANVAHRFSSDLEGSPRALACAAFGSAQPWYGSYLELALRRTVISLSPELFLQFDPVTREVVTRPIKGTRPIGDDPRTLALSHKDAAELHMIVDLMRNDLGRVCDIGSIRVANARDIETHPTVHHGVGEVAGILRKSAGVVDLLRATFPGGSVTGAPKIRAMQVIDELEPVKRGWYCGAIGSISDNGAMQLSIAIRTMLLSAHRTLDHGRVRATLDYSAGAGIVADSKPSAEYEETLHKARVLLALAESPDLVAHSSN